MKQSLLGVALFCSLVLAGSGWAQTFDLGGQSSAQSQKPAATQKNKKKQSGEMLPSTGGLGWGSSIEVGRNARAAQDALKKGNAAAAMNFAGHMTQAAPKDPRNWFLLAYTSRLAGRYQQSLDAYQRGLAYDPGSIEGLSGLAQTYMRMGRADDAKRLLLRVIEANPRRATDLALAGELFMQSGDLPRATDLLERSEAVGPSAHAELLLAITYMKAKETDKAKQLLDRAMHRSPGNTDIARAVAQYYRTSEDYKSAISILQHVPHKNVDVLSELGYTYGLAGMKKESADEYEKAAEGAPNAVNVQLATAEAQLRVGDLEKTRTYLTRAEQLDGGHYRLHAIRGDLAMLERRDPDAVREYEAALAALPEGPAEGILYPTELRLNLIDAFKHLEDPASVEEQLAIASKDLAGIQMQGPQRTEYLRLRAAIKGLSEDFDGAEADLKEALQLEPENEKILLQYGSLLWRIDRKEEAKQIYTGLLERDGKSRYALEAMGYLSRDLGDSEAAEGFFTRMAEAYPNDYVPYMALGDLYTSLKDFPKAETNYEKAYSLAPTNSQIIAGGSNAAIEAHQVDLAGEWVERATGVMKNDPRIIRETERYLFLKGQYAESERLGEEAVQRLPHDRDAAVYLAYDLYNLGRYDEVLSFVSRYETILPKEPNFPLLAGHVHTQNQLLQQAIDDFTRAFRKDPNMVEVLVNRGYARNDMQDAQGAIRDFQPVIAANPDDGVAHLGLAFSYLQLHRSPEALEETNKAEKIIGEIGPTHMARATAYRQMRVLDKAEKEYRAALTFAPDDVKLHEALADTLYHARRYTQAIGELENTLRLSPDDPLIYANLAAAHAQLQHRAETFKYIEAAERQGTDQSAILLAAGDALMTLGDRSAAMDHFTRALDAPDANRVDVRMEFAKLFVREGKMDAAKEEVGLAFAESRIGEASPITTDNLVEAANVFLAAHDFDLAQRYFTKAKQIGASDDTVAIGLADTYIAQGKDQEAAKALRALGDSPDYLQNYDYELAWGNIYSQQHDNRQAISAFARANQIAAGDPTAERAMLEATEEEGTPVRSDVNARSNLSTSAVFEDATLYEMDTKLIGSTVAPRSSQETDVGSSFRYHLQGSPLPINGYFGIRNFNGTFSLPSEVAIIRRNTFDTIFDVGTTSVQRWGNMRFNLTPGLMFTIRRDTDSPVQMNQQLFRQYLYLSTSPLFQWLTVRGSAIHEAGPFTEQNQSSRDLAAGLEFEVGRPWGKTAMITGYSVRDLLFSPVPREFFTTSTWGGLEHKWGEKVSATVLARYVRSWRVQTTEFTIAQILVPGVRVQVKPKERWTVDAAVDFTRGQGFDIYDNVQSGFLVSYVKPLRRSVNDGMGAVPVDYPLRFSVGLQQQSFFNFTGPGQTTSYRPVIKISLF